MSEQVCVLCEKKDKILNLQNLTEKGATSLNTTIEKRKDKHKQVSIGQYVHNNCRKNYSSERKILQSLPKQNFIGEKNYACKSSVSVSAEPNISRITSTFDFKNTCFFKTEDDSNEDCNTDEYFI